MSDALDLFSPATREWFRGAFAAPTAAQEGAWRAISAGSHTLVVAPTGSGKTLAAFLWSIDRLAAEPPADPRTTRVLYISPLKALAVDVERNLRSPLVGVTQTAKRLGLPAPAITVGVRSGDTPSSERRMLQRRPPDILITTPESLYLMLTSAARETLRGVETVIVDEIHAVASTKRGAHLAVSLERLDALLERPAQRIGLSATVRPREEVARFLGGSAPVTIVAPPSIKTFDLTVVVPVEDMTEVGSAPRQEGSAATSAPQGSIWPHVEEQIVDRILENRSTIVFANSRRLAERLTARLNEIYGERMADPEDTEPDAFPGTLEGERAPAAVSMDAGGNSLQPLRVPQGTIPAVSTLRPAQWSPSSTGGVGAMPGATTLLARAHHGSVSKDQRAMIEDDLKSGRLRCVVATSSLELGIDMGAVDLVIQVEAPPSVAGGLQRVGRAGHQVGEISRGILFPKHRADLIHSAVVSERMSAGLIEAMSIPANPLDVLAQHTVAAVALDTVDVEEWFDTVRRSAPFRSLPRSAYDATLDLLSGLYPSDEFAELRPRIVWDRVKGTLTGRPGAQRLAVTSGGTIPDRGLFGVFMVGASTSSIGGSGGGSSGSGGGRVGELDEEMVYESRVGDVFALGATSWRIEDITHDRVLVTPAFGQPGRVPFWKGDGIGRPAELGRAIGAFIREVASASPDVARARVSIGGLDEKAVNNLVAFIGDQRKATGHVPTDRTLVVERFRDELGDWRVVLHSPYGMRVHAPWALAIGARIHEKFGTDGSAMASDDGVVLRIPDTDAEPPGAELFLFASEELRDIVTEQVGGSALFASRFRECAARALLLPRYNPGRRSPLWQQRQRSAQLLAVAAKYPSFPIVLETVREVLQDVYDLPALTELAAAIESHRIRVIEVETEQASPFARSLLFGYVAAFMYEGDSPLAERRAAALSLDPTLLAELLGRAELRELLDEAVIEQTELELQRLAPDRRARDAEGIVDLLRLLGPLSTAEIAQRTVPGFFDDEPLPPSPEEQPRDGAASRREAPTSGNATIETLARAGRVFRTTIAGEDRWAGIEDASRLRDALGTPLPIGIPTAFVEPVAEPLGDLVGRFARTHGPFTVPAVGQRFGLGTAVVLDTLRRLAGQRRVVEGEFRPGASGSEWCDVEVLRRLRSRSLAALRHEVEPVDAATLGRFLPAWHHLGGPHSTFLTGLDGVAHVIDQLAGVPLPASAWESLILPARVRDYSPAMLDELTTTGEVLWAGRGSLPGNDGWISLHLADTAPLTLPLPDIDLLDSAMPDGAAPEASGIEHDILAALSGGGAYFFRQLGAAIGSTDDRALTTALWDLVWAGRITNDTLAPLRAHLGGTARAHPHTRTFRGRARASLPRASGPPSAGGRWSLLPTIETDATVRALAIAESLLERHGVVTRGAVAGEGIAGGFSLVYKVLSRFEESGRARRGYFIEGLGAAQFATGATVDRLRSFTRDPDSGETPTALALAATDPANPYGAALPWPRSTGNGGSMSIGSNTDPAATAGTGATASEGTSDKRGHRPGRKAGALVVLVDGALALHVERGGKTVLTFDLGEDALQSAADALAAVTLRSGGRLRVERVDGAFVIGTPLGDALIRAGFSTTPQGLRLRG